MILCSALLILVNVLKEWILFDFCVVSFFCLIEENAKKNLIYSSMLYVEKKKKKTR